MSVTYGFYNSLNHDRRYSALDMSQIFDGLIGNGIYETIGDAMTVKAGSGMTVNVQTGRAWFDHTWTYNSTILPLQLEPSQPIVSRIDAVVLEIDARMDYRENSIKIVSGEPSLEPQKPTMIKEAELHQYPLAYVTVGPEVTEIIQANIQNMVGTEDTPFVIGIVKTMDAQFLIDQWESTIETWFNRVVADFDEWERDRMYDFYEWFENLQYVLDGDVAGHLQNEIDNMGVMFIDKDGYISYDYDHVRYRRE